MGFDVACGQPYNNKRLHDSSDSENNSPPKKKFRHGWRKGLSEDEVLSVVYQEGYNPQDVNSDFDIRLDKEEIKERVQKVHRDKRKMWRLK